MNPTNYALSRTVLNVAICKLFSKQGQAILAANVCDRPADRALPIL